MGRGREEVRRIEVVCKMCGAEHTGEVMKKVVDNCPKCGSYAVRPKRA